MYHALKHWYFLMLAVLNCVVYVSEVIQESSTQSIKYNASPAL